MLHQFFSATYIIWLFGKVSYIWHAVFMGLNISDNLHFHAWTTLTGCVISGFHHEVDENCVLLGYALSSGNFLLTVWDNLSISSSKVKNKKKSWPLKKGTICCLEMLVQNYHYSLRNNPKHSSSHTQWHYHDFQNSTHKNNRKLTYKWPMVIYTNKHNKSPL